MPDKQCVATSTSRSTINLIKVTSLRLGHDIMLSSVFSLSLIRIPALADAKYVLVMNKLLAAIQSQPQSSLLVAPVLIDPISIDLDFFDGRFHLGTAMEDLWILGGLIDSKSTADKFDGTIAYHILF